MLGAFINHGDKIIRSARILHLALTNSLMELLASSKYQDENSLPSSPTEDDNNPF